MTQEVILQLMRETLQLTLFLSAPLLLTALLVGVVISILQVVTSIQDATLSFVPRIIAMIVVILLAMPWLMERMSTFTARLFGDLSAFIGIR